MLNAAIINDIAEQLLRAEKTRERIPPPSARHPGMTVDDAYAIQRALVAMKVAEGRTIKGHKIGLTSRAMQSIVGIDEPDYGALLDDMSRTAAVFRSSGSSRRVLNASLLSSSGAG
jgi:2-oxo-hept-3-ene-1,7-dioate hydratase